MLSLARVFTFRRLLVQLAFLSDLYDVPPELVANSDQTGVPLVPSSNYQWARKGSKDVSVNGFEEKRQITVTPTTTAAGESLPLQVFVYSACQECAVGSNSNMPVQSLGGRAGGPQRLTRWI
jgi:hypothetical protein